MTKQAKRIILQDTVVVNLSGNSRTSIDVTDPQLTQYKIALELNDVGVTVTWTSPKNTAKCEEFVPLTSIKTVTIADDRGAVEQKKTKAA